jgi:hypothetical protein
VLFIYSAYSAPKKFVHSVSSAFAVRIKKMVAILAKIVPGKEGDLK